MVIERISKAVWQEFVYGGHLLSLGAVSIVYTASILLGIKITWDFLTIVYLGTESIYLYNRYKEFEIDSLTNPERTSHIKKNIKKIPFVILIFFLIGFSILIYYQKFAALLFGVILFILGLLYSKVFKSLTQRIVGFKNFFVSLMWTLLVVLLAVYYSLPFNLALFLISIFVFLRLLDNTIFFDIKDVESDRKKHLITLPIVLEDNKLFKSLVLITFSATVPIIVGVFLGLLPTVSLLLFFTVPYGLYCFKKSRETKTNIAFLYNVIRDGEYILWSLFILLGKFLL